MCTAIVAAAAAILGAVVGGVVLIINGDRQRRAEQTEHERTARVEFRRQQLSLLYGPLYQQRRRSERLRDQLPQTEPDGSRWRLVHHIAETSVDPKLARIVDRIMAAGAKTAELIASNAGLMEHFPPPGAFQKFVEHHELLKMSWDTGQNQDPENSRPFPGGISSEYSIKRCEEQPGSEDDDIDCAIYLGMKAINQDLENLLGLQGKAVRQKEEPNV
jgi:hypothetical protein